MLIEAIQRYHDLLTPAMAAESDEVLQAGLRARGLYFGDRPLCKVLRPHFYVHDDWNYLRDHTEVLLRAFAKAHAACFERDDLRAQLDLEPYEEQLFHLDAGLDVPWTSSRLDSFFVSDERVLSFVEYNAETPAGIGYGDLLSDVFKELPVMHQFQQYYEISDFPGMGHLMGAILLCWRRWGGREHPQVAIVDWSDVPTLNEHEIIRDYFTRNGLHSILADPRQMEFRNGALWVGDFRVDLIYRRVLVSELIQRMGVDNPIITALRARAVMMTNSVSAKLLSKKASLALLSDEQNHFLFDAEEIAIINAHIPWTRRVSDRRTRYQGAAVDLLEFISTNRERLVLKPNDDYGGRGVVIGWESTQEVWDEALRDALTTPHVAQERARPVYRDFPMLLDDGSLDISKRFVDANPYVFYGKTVGGCLTRLSSETLLNVTAGGGSVAPTFILRRKA